MLDRATGVNPGDQHGSPTGHATSPTSEPVPRVQPITSTVPDVASVIVIAS